MSKVRVKLKIGGIREVLKSAEVQAAVTAEANRIRDRAGDGFGVAVVPHKWTARAFVQTESAAAARSEAKDKTLTRAFGGAR